MRLTIVILSIFTIGLGAESYGAKPAAKPAKKAVVKKTAARAAPAKTATRAVAKKGAPARPAPARSAAKAAPARAVVGKTAPARAASRAPAQEAPVPAVPAGNRASTDSTQDTTGLANSIRSMSSGPVMGGGGGIARGPGSSHEIGEAMRVTGQSRNLSMGLLFSKDNDKIEFGNPRMHYKDKITSQQANY